MIGKALLTAGGIGLAIGVWFGWFYLRRTTKVGPPDHVGRDGADQHGPLPEGAVSHGQVPQKTDVLEAESGQILTLRPVSLTDKAYAAGFFDGEGTLGIYRRKSRGKIVPWQYAGTASLTNSNYEILTWFRSRWGGGIGAPIITPNPALVHGHALSLFSRPVFHWTLNHRSMAVFLSDIYPHLRVKQELAANVLAFTKTMGVQGGNYLGLPPDVYAKQTWHFDRHRELRKAIKEARQGPK